MRQLDGLIMLKELEKVSDLSFHQLKRKYDKSIVIIKRISYVYASVIPEYEKEKLTTLTNYVQLTELARKLNIDKGTLKDRVKIMQELGEKLYFDYMSVENVYFVKLNEELQKLFAEFIPCVITKKYRKDSESKKDIKFTKLLGDLTVGFY